ncbi:hypothetical protein J2Y03_003566 [Neobacillus niacini]|nr:hypothetical protein [Neobacillus niacini]
MRLGPLFGESGLSDRNSIIIGKVGTYTGY